MLKAVDRIREHTLDRLIFMDMLGVFGKSPQRVLPRPRQHRRYIPMSSGRGYSGVRAIRSMILSRGAAAR